MKSKRFGVTLPGFNLTGIAATALMFFIAAPWSEVCAGPAPTYSIDFHLISSGGSPLHNVCYSITGSLGQAVPGYSSSNVVSLFAGFWSAVPIERMDGLFINGFEEC